VGRQGRNGLIRMCDIGNALSRIFTPKGTGGLEAAATQAADDALAATQRAKASADVAAAGPKSSEAAAQDEEARLRLLLASTGSNAAFAGAPIGATAVGTKMLTGS